MIKALEASTVRKINSGQVITDMKSVVKELVENSLDAGADYIDVRLEDAGFGSITVADNGSGISRKDRGLCALGHHTSKIVDLSSLESLASYGFRGEALHSICECSASVQITTMTSSEKSATTVNYSRTGTPDSTKPAPAISAVPLTAHTHGTTIVASGLWSAHPVRKEYLRSLAKTEARRIQEMMLAYALVHPGVRFVLKNPPAKIFVSGPCADVGQAILTNYGPLLFETLQRVEFSNDVVRIEGFLPSKTAEKSIALRKTNDRCFLYVNSRPVDFPKISKMVNTAARKWFDVGDSKSYPFILLNFLLDPNLYDINMTPDKRKVLFVNDEDIFKAVSDMLLAMYPLRSIDENGCNGNNEGDGENSVFKSHTKNKLSKGTSAGDNGQSYSTQLTDFFKKRQPKEAHKQADDNKINDDRDETMDNYVIPSSPDNEDLVFDTTSTQRQLSGKRRRRQENNEINSNININNEENEEEEEEEDCYSPPTKKLPKNISFSSTSPTSSTKSINDKKDQQNKKKKPIERLGAINEDIPVSIEPDIISQAQLGITHASPRNSVIRIKHSAISLGDERYWVPTSAENAEIVGITKIGSLQKAFWTFLIFQDPSKPSQARLTQPQRSYSMQTTQQQQQQQQQQQSSLSSSSSSSSLSSLSTSSSSFPSSVDASPSRQSANASPRIFLLSWERAEEAIHIIQQVRRGVYPSDPVLGPPLRLTEVDISDSVAWRLLCQHSKRTTDALTLNSFKVVTDDSNQAAIKVVAVPRGIDHNDVAKEIKDVLKQLLRGTKLPICQYVGKAMLAKTPMKKLVGPPTPETGLALLRDIVSSRVSSCPHGKRVFQFLGNYQIK